MLKRSLCALALATALAACTNQPMVQWREAQWQEKIQTSAHWQTIATRTVDKLLVKLAEVPDFDQTGHTLGAGERPRAIGLRPIYLRPLDPSMPFARAFHDFMVRELMLRDRQVASSAAGAVVVNYNVQALAYDRDVGSQIHYGDITVATAAVAGTAFIFEKWSTAHAYLGTIGIAAIADAYIWLTETPNAEIIVTAEVASEKGPLFKSADIFYVKEADIGLYVNSFGVRPAAPMLTGAKAPAPTPTRNLRVSAN